MRIALMKCGEFINAGQKDELHVKLLELKDYAEHCHSAPKLSQKFYKTVEAGPDSSPISSIFPIVPYAIYSSLIWFVLFIIWGIIFWRKCSVNVRSIYLGFLTGLLFWFLLMISAGRLVMNGYSCTAWKYDISTLTDATAEPVFPQELLTLLETPKETAYEFLAPIK